MTVLCSFQNTETGQNAVKKTERSRYWKFTENVLEITEGYNVALQIISLC